MASVTIASVKKNFGEVPILHGVDIDIQDGSFTVLVGPSGCGKSTLLRMIAGLEQISSGEIRIGNKRVNDLPPKERDIAMVFQNYALYPHMTVRQNMAFSLELAKESKSDIETKVHRAAEILALDPLPNATPVNCLAANVNVSPWDARLCVTHRFSYSTNPSLTSTPNCVSPCAARSKNYTNGQSLECYSSLANQP